MEKGVNDMATEEKQLNLFASNHISDEDIVEDVETLEHIASCDICAASYMEMIETNSLIKAPHYMKANILQKSKKLIKKEQHSKQVQLFHYSMKVGLAMCGALAMIFLSSFGSISSTKSNQEKINLEQLEKGYSVSALINNMTYDLREFSNSMVQYADTLVINNKNDMGVNKNEEEKK